MIMRKKNRQSEDPENPEVEQTNTEITEADLLQTQNKSASVDSQPQQTSEDSSEELSSAGDSTASPKQKDEVATEDLLDDVRRSLIEAESDKDREEVKWWRRIGKRNTRREPEPAQEEIDLPTPLTPAESIPPQKQEAADEEYEQQIDDLIHSLEQGVPEAVVEPVAVTPEPESPPEPEIDIEKLKEQAFRPRTVDEAQPESDVRSIALEGGEEVFVEVQAQRTDPLQERLSAFENALKPYRSYLYLTLAFLGAVMAVIAGLFIFNVYQQSRPQPVKEVSNLPYPTAVSLPGGWTFQLATGSLQAGNWQPSGPEWLEGTEVCRWISLPWSRQLEAVLRTLNPKDPIELVMSNNDKLEYLVYSVRELSPEEIQQVDSNSPCLLIILAQSDSEKRWVLTALP
jgi:hypothetical protein